MRGREFSNQSRYRLGHGLIDRRIVLRFPTRTRHFSLHQSVQTGHLSPSHEDYSPPSSTEVKNAWGYTFIPLHAFTA
jgi:hypothetical protein